MNVNNKIINYFLEHPDQFISGEELSQQFDCSRTAIWKHIQRLRQNGYEFEAVSRKGYRLLKSPENLQIDQIEALLHTQVMGKQIDYMPVASSTQVRAHKLAGEGAVEGTLVIAEQQTEGRGRMGKKWFSPSGTGIWMSLILKPRVPMQFTSQLTLLTSVALCRAIKQLTTLNISIKWPNDLLIEHQKACGILLESRTEDERLHYIVAGIGISVNMTENDFPKELRNDVTSLRIALGKSVNREQLIVHFLEEFERLYDHYQEHGFSAIRSLWEALSISLHRPIEVFTGQETISGTAVGLDDLGALLVQDGDGNVMKIYSGDVSHVKG